MFASLSRDQVVQMARSIAEQEGWPWLEPVEVARHRRFPQFWRFYWHVKTNAKFGTQSVYVRIDDSSRRVLQVAYAPY